MPVVELKYIIQNDKNIDKNLEIFSKDIKDWANKIGGDKLHIQVRMREAKDGDIRASVIIGVK